eukprot:TRINITY_DN4292_c0_g1_i1.p1 TRINITY_DN4292_c0_g1~~TRINITY_DN4292_c0_g1_i1.p1  ORF type:complete len:239 (+),score=56.41 TRINITY_DN4292_c0_g1_i1:36-752(+)
MNNEENENSENEDLEEDDEEEDMIIGCYEENNSTINKSEYKYGNNKIKSMKTSGVVFIEPEEVGLDKYMTVVRIKKTLNKRSDYQYEFSVLKKWVIEGFDWRKINNQLCSNLSNGNIYSHYGGKLESGLETWCDEDDIITITLIKKNLIGTLIGEDILFYDVKYHLYKKSVNNNEYNNKPIKQYECTICLKEEDLYDYNQNKNNNSIDKKLPLIGLRLHWDSEAEIIKYDSLTNILFD